ncbi:DsbA family protein [Candidatus Woesearchaeota archaeon]|nr:DsbA family protein [Candidatus Woesearchaeota archaeon]
MSEEHQGTKKDSSELYSKLGTWSSVLSVILLLVIALQLGDLGKSLKGGTVQAGNDAPAIQPGDSAPAPTVDMAKLVDDDPMLGNKNAPVTIVEFSDFECPYCGRFHSQTFPQIKQEYIDTGKVRFVYRDFPLGFHQNAQKAAEASECADEQGKFWQMHEKLFSSGVQGGTATFKQYAQEIGLDMAKFNSCLDSGKYAGEIQADLSAGSQAGVSGTPGFLVNGQRIDGAQPYAVFQQAIEAALG